MPTSVGRRGGQPPADAAQPVSSLPPNAAVVRELLVAKMYHLAVDELRYAQTLWGDSSSIGATLAWTYREQGKVETGSVQFSLYHGAINLMKRAYPQYLAAGGEQLPRAILRIIYPIAYWESIQKYAGEAGLDPYMVAALAAQESTFVANIRSPAKAVGLLQLEPSTARQVAKRIDMKYTSKTLTDPDANLRLGTAYSPPRFASSATCISCWRATTPARAPCIAGSASARACRGKSSSTTFRTRDPELRQKDSRNGGGLSPHLRCGGRRRVRR